MSRFLGVYFAAAILMIAVNISSCASEISYDPRPPGSPVSIFRQYQPECDYVKLGKVTDSDGDVLKNAAREMGGNGLIIKEGGTAFSRKGGVTPGAEPIHTRKLTMRGTVILFTNPACTD
jgi:hypothetical protein